MNASGKVRYGSLGPTLEANIPYTLKSMLILINSLPTSSVSENNILRSTEFFQFYVVSPDLVETLLASQDPSRVAERLVGSSRIEMMSSTYYILAGLR